MTNASRLGGVLNAAVGGLHLCLVQGPFSVAPAEPPSTDSPHRTLTHARSVRPFPRTPRECRAFNYHDSAFSCLFWQYLCEIDPMCRAKTRVGRGLLPMRWGSALSAEKCPPHTNCVPLSHSRTTLLHAPLTATLHQHRKPVHSFPPPHLTRPRVLPLRLRRATSSYRCSWVRRTRTRACSCCWTA
jgi:hypothetical protein